MLSCPTEEDVLDFAMGQLASSRLPEIHRHLDECEACQQLLTEAAHAVATAATVPFDDREGAAWNTTFRPGTLVGQRYLIRRYITRGGMGEVYEAYDRDLQERVALKTVTSTASDSQKAVRALKAEVQLARRVSHPNVCRIYDFGTHLMPRNGGQISFLTMEFVEGETLGQRLRLGGAIPIPEARALGRQLLLGLSAAHNAGVLHRDFKSDNVMLRNEAGEEVTPLIMDFGLARALDHDSTSGGSSSNPALLGTLGYIAPEQLEGKGHSKASDVYALGIVWFEMLTGESPFDSSSSPALAVFERLKRDAPAPSTKNHLVPKDLDALILGCLRRSPKDRYRTAGEVLAALDELEKAHAPRTLRAWASAAAALGFAGSAAYFALTAPARIPAQRTALVSLASALPAQEPIVPPTTVAEPPLVEPHTPGDHATSSHAPSKPATPPHPTQASDPTVQPSGTTAGAGSKPATAPTTTAPAVTAAPLPPSPFEDPFHQHPLADPAQGGSRG